jgi:hypothetical protein
MSWMWQERRLGRGKSDFLDVAREMYLTWQERRLGCGKSDILDVVIATSLTWQERRLGCGKSNVLDMARATLREIIFDMVAMGATLLEVARPTSWRWKE